jgi:hypothetical protein
MRHFAYRHGFLHAEAVSVATIANAVGTPFYCYATATLRTPLPGFCRRRAQPHVWPQPISKATASQRDCCRSASLTHIAGMLTHRRANNETSGRERCDC